MGELRITSGTLRGRKVRAPDGEGTRPLLTRVRKSLVDILRPGLPGARVLDLFAGSGAIAFELVSNGAAGAVAVDRDRRAAERIRENARRLGVTDAVEVVCGDALDVVPLLAARGTAFDRVVVAPPYGHGLQAAALAILAAHPAVLAPGFLVVTQRDRREPSVPAPAGMVLERTRRYGRTSFEFYGPETVPRRAETT